jgi:hypothetical protein
MHTFGLAKIKVEMSFWSIVGAKLLGSLMPGECAFVFEHPFELLLERFLSCNVSR